MFASDLGDKIHTCNNKCVFCFIHQMPRGERRMRKTLYLMDDDFRLSFMHGNYVTLTNVSDATPGTCVRNSPAFTSTISALSLLSSGAVPTGGRQIARFFALLLPFEIDLFGKC